MQSRGNSSWVMCLFGNIRREALEPGRRILKEIYVAKKMLIFILTKIFYYLKIRSGQHKKKETCYESHRFS